MLKIERTVNNGASFWGDSEGTLRLTWAGPTIPNCMVITLQAIHNAGVWTNKIVGPDVFWIVQEINIPGGPFNPEPGLTNSISCREVRWTFPAPCLPPYMTSFHGGISTAFQPAPCLIDGSQV